MNQNWKYSSFKSEADRQYSNMWYHIASLRTYLEEGWPTNGEFLDAVVHWAHKETQGNFDF